MADINTYKFTQTAQRLQAIMNRVEALAGVESLTCVTTNTTHALTGGSTGFDNAVFKFKADADFNSTDTVTVNGVIVTCLLPTGDTIPDGFVVSGASALCILDGTSLYFVGGGSGGSGVKYFLDQIVTSWESDTTYPQFPYRGFISIPRVSSADGVEVSFSNDDANSGNYSPICQSTTDGVYIWAKTQPQSLTIPTIAITVNDAVELDGEAPYLSTERGGTVNGDVVVNGDISADNLSDYVKKTGDTMTGSLAVKSSNIDADAEHPSNIQYGTMVEYTDADDRLLGSTRLIRRPSGEVALFMMGRAEINGAEVLNGLALGVNEDGTRRVVVTDSAPWLTALGLTITQASPTTVSNSHYTIANPFTFYRFGRLVIVKGNVQCTTPSTTSPGEIIFSNIPTPTDNQYMTFSPSFGTTGTPLRVILYKDNPATMRVRYGQASLYYDIAFVYVTT